MNFLNILLQLGRCGNWVLCLLLVLFLATQCFFHSFINKIKGHFPWKLAAPRSNAGRQTNSSFDAARKCQTYFKLWQQVWNPHWCAAEVNLQWHVQKLAGGCPFPAYEKKSWLLLLRVDCYYWELIVIIESWFEVPAPWVSCPAGKFFSQFCDVAQLVIIHKEIYQIRL
jgi:hypothetical protein